MYYDDAKPGSPVMQGDDSAPGRDIMYFIGYILIKLINRVFTKPFVILAGLLAALGSVDGRSSANEIADGARTNGFAELSRTYVALAIQGDLRQAPSMFEASVGGGAAGAALREQFSERFLEPAVSPASQPAITDPAEAVARAYRNYWRQNLMRENDTSEAEAALVATLSGILQSGSHMTEPDLTSERLTLDLLEQSGWHYSVASTPPWRDLFVWKSEQRANFRVELTDVSVPVEVIFMDDFVVQGWKDFASLGLASTTGWVEDERLYCVAWAYDTTSENFAVSYLKHEARHLADLRRFPDMDTVELEYRAKLTELAFAHRDLQRIWNDFRAKAANNPASPHAQANWRVVRAVEGALAAVQRQETPDASEPVDATRVNRAARRLLRENTDHHLAASKAAAR